MKRRITNYYSVLTLVLFMALLSLSIAHAAPDLSWTKKVGARKVPTKTTIFWANTYGATNDGKTLASPFIQRAIDECAKKGGGIVAFKPGAYLTGSIFLKSNVHLRIDKGVLLRGSTSFNDYPEIDTRIAGIEMKWPAALINIIRSKKC
jgi:polygalacturonase